MGDLDFRGKTALVVGGSSGIGNAIARALNTRGADVHVWGTRSSASNYAEDDGSDLSGLHYGQMDAADFAAIEAYRPPFQALDILVLSQGLVMYKRQEFEIPHFRRVLDVNLSSLMACAQRFKPFLSASRGSIVVISSTAAFHSTKGNPAYNASKAGALGLTRTLADAWAEEGIRVNGIAPGFVATKMTKVTTDSPKRLAAMMERVPLKRPGTAEEIAGVALFLASPLASYVLGQTIPVDGGLLL